MSACTFWGIPSLDRNSAQFSYCTGLRIEVPLVVDEPWPPNGCPVAVLDLVDHSAAFRVDRQLPRLRPGKKLLARGGARLQLHHARVPTPEVWHSTHLGLPTSWAGEDFGSRSRQLQAHLVLLGALSGWRPLPGAGVSTSRSDTTHPALVRPDRSGCSSHPLSPAIGVHLAPLLGLAPKLVPRADCWEH